MKGGASASLFGTALLTKGAESVNQKSFRTYDRMLPAQDHMPMGGLGNVQKLLFAVVISLLSDIFMPAEWRVIFLYSNVVKSILQ